MKIAIASGKGGTGKTTLSTNLATYLSESMNVLLVDLDVEEPNSGLFIEASLTHTVPVYKMIPKWDESKCTFCGICSKTCKFHAVLRLGTNITVFKELCHSCYACSELCPENALPMIPEELGVITEYHSGRLHFLESRLNIGEEQAVPLISKTKKYIAGKQFHPDITIYDAPPGTSCPVIETIKDADFVILVTEPTPFGLHDFTLAVETVKKLQKKFGVVINKAGSGNSDVEAYCSKQNIKILGQIPYSRKIAELYSSGELVYKHIPELKDVMAEIISNVNKNVSTSLS
jgi:MinD superfamily P-loop ATPase